MKLSPPASSSDLEAAREIARRLHQHRRRQDRSMPEDQPAATRPAPPLAAPRPHPEPPPPLAPPTPELESAPKPPSWDEGTGEASPTDDPLAGFDEPGPAAEDSTNPGETPRLDVEEPTVSPEEMIGSAEPPSFEALQEPETYDSSPFEVELDGEASEEDSEAAPAPPSWDDIVQACLTLAQASGAMLIDPSGQVFAARGEWPEPGPDAIAAKLVSTMDRTLKDAPTRSISAPLMGRHLTAWRVPLAEGLVTAAFIGGAPVRADARPAIDTEIHRGAGA